MASFAAKNVLASCNDFGPVWLSMMDDEKVDSSVTTVGHASSYLTWSGSPARSRD